jgi:hypothetical protein
MGAKAPQPAPNRRPDGTIDPAYRKPEPSPPPPPPRHPTPSGWQRADADAPLLPQMRRARAEGARAASGESKPEAEPPALPFTLDVNDTVKVKLKPNGMRIYLDHYDNRLMPKVDADGYTKFQLWQLMAIFGPHIHLACDPPFETTIVVGPDF